MKLFQIKDIVQTLEEFGGHQHIIIGITTEPLIYHSINTKNKKKYTLKPEQIDFKVSEGKIENYIDLTDYDEGVLFATRQARQYPKEAKKWKFLAGLKPGDKLQLIHRKTIYPAIFLQINVKKPLYPIRAEFARKVGDFPLESLVLPLQV